MAHDGGLIGSMHYQVDEFRADSSPLQASSGQWASFLHEKGQSLGGSFGDQILIKVRSR